MVTRTTQEMSQYQNFVDGVLVNTQRVPGRYSSFVQNSMKGDKKTPTPYSYTKYTSAPSSGSITKKTSPNGSVSVQTGTIGEISFGTYASNGFLDHDPGVLRQRADADARRSFFKNKTDDNVDVGSDAGEAFGGRGGMSYDGIDPSVKSAAEQADRNIRKGSIAVARDLWFKKAFVIQPLVNTVFTVLGRQASMFNSTDFVVKGSGQAANTGFRRVPYGTKYGIGDNNCYLTRMCDNEARVRYKAVYGVTDPFLHEVNKWTTFNPGLVAWNALPCSWVVDYFFGIGDYLAGLESSLDIGCVFKHGFISSLWIERLYATTSGRNTSRGLPTQAGSFYQDEQAYHEETVRFTRTRLLATPSMPRPNFDWDLTSGQAYNLGVMASGWMK